MNNETLDQLLADRALGELTPDVAELLEAWLAREPSAARRAATMQATVAQAKAAIASQTEPVHFDANARGGAPRFVSALRARTRAQPWRRAASLAATLVVGLGLGWWIRPSPEPVRVVGTVDSAPAFAAPLAMAPAGNFWSLKRFAHADLTRESSPRMWHIKEQP